MLLHEMLACIDWLCSLQQPVHVFLTGGEPLLSPYLAHWLAATQTYPNLRVSVSTNGTLLTREIVAQLAGARIGMVLVSIDGWDAVSHEYHSQVEGSFDSLLNGLGLLLESSLRDQVVTNTVLTHANVEHWERIASMLRQLGVKRAKFSPVLLPTDIAALDDMALTSSDLLEYRHIRQGLHGIHNESYEKFEARMCDIILNRHGEPMECFAGLRFFFVRSDARVFPCWQASSGEFKLRVPRRCADTEANAPKLYDLSSNTDLTSRMGQQVSVNRSAVCLDCCDAFNLASSAE